jgi:hypothetical protein
MFQKNQRRLIVNTAEKIFLAFGNITSVLAALIYLFAKSAMMQISTLHTKLNHVDHYLKVYFY